MNASLTDLATPCLLLDRERMQRNIRRLQTHVHALGATLRPHLKTSKSVDVARLLLDHPGAGVTVSTLREAEVFAAAGIRDIVYAVGITPDKLARVADLRRAGCDLTVLLDSPAQAAALAAFAAQHGLAIPALLEIDCDGHRSGILPTDEARLVALATQLTQGGCVVRGVLTHAGESYHAYGPAALRAAAENERVAAVTAAQCLRAHGFACPVVSVGSTPTAHFAQNLAGVTEVRAGVFVFFDLVMAGLGVCQLDDLALSVLTTVIGHQPAKGWLLVDAGWMALSRDRGTASQPADQDYGLVCTLEGTLLEGWRMVGTNQEHGILAASGPAPLDLSAWPIGTKLRILPNHACATAAQFDEYQVLAQGKSIASWPRFRGW